RAARSGLRLRPAGWSPGTSTPPRRRHGRPAPGPARPARAHARLRAALRQRAGVGWRRWRCHVSAGARAAAAAVATVAREVAEEVGPSLKPDPDLVLTARVGESPAGLERSADCRASAGEGVWRSEGKNGVGLVSGGWSWACLQIYQTGVSNGRDKRGPVGAGERYSDFQMYAVDNPKVSNSPPFIVCYDLSAKMKPDETPLFDPSLLKEVDWSQNTATFSPAISPTHPGEGLVLRPLCTADLNRGFFKVLGQLTETGAVNPEQFMKSFEHMKKSGDYYVTVVEDVTLGQIVATATLIIEHKFIHSCAKRGRVEDVVVSDECRGKQLGKLLLSTLTLLSKKLNCYKITLECLPQNVGFYKKFGYTVSEENY
ncbi:Glucosamine 6-phosphate N-acetyltransferase, partial [Galemys pyrenaicus]